MGRPLGGGDSQAKIQRNNNPWINIMGSESESDVAQ